MMGNLQLAHNAWSSSCLTGEVFLMALTIYPEDRQFRKCCSQQSLLLLCTCLLGHYQAMTVFFHCHDNIFHHFTHLGLLCIVVTSSIILCLRQQYWVRDFELYFQQINKRSSCGHRNWIVIKLYVWIISRTTSLQCIGNLVSGTVIV
jgi:hypothetical protein